MNSFSQMGEWIRKKRKKPNKTDFLVMILLGVLVMIIAIPSGSEKKERNLKNSQSETSDGEKGRDLLQSEDDYRSSLEKRLEELIGSMEGAGESTVMITLADEGQTYVDKNVSVEENKRDEETVVYDTGDGNEPFVVRREQPKVEGVVVVSEGGDNPRVVTEISNAVMALFHIEAHKVTVIPMKNAEDKN